MPKIVAEVPFDGAIAKIERLGLQQLINEVKKILTNFKLLVEESKHANSGQKVRELIDAEFIRVGGWQNTVTGDIDWVKCKTVNGSKVCIGVEVQVSIRSDLITRDIVHFQKQLRKGSVDLCILILPSDALARYLPSRAPHISAGIRIVEEMRADDLPMLFLAIEHDGSGPALAKKKTNKGKGKKKKRKTKAPELEDEAQIEDV
jgi:hypothetical protein